MDKSRNQTVTDFVLEKTRLTLLNASVISNLHCPGILLEIAQNLLTIIEIQFSENLCSFLTKQALLTQPN